MLKSCTLINQRGLCFSQQKWSYSVNIMKGFYWLLALPTFE